MTAKKVQSYLDEHRIGPLFEDLMAKLIKDMPSQPIPYLIKSLKKLYPDSELPKSGFGRPPSGSRSMTPSAMSKSISLTGSPITRKSFDDKNRDVQRSALAKSWAAPDTSDPYKDHTKQRDYQRPWLAGSKPLKTEPSRPGSKTKKAAEKGQWNNDTRVPTHDFDELFQYQNGPAKNKTVDYDGAQTWNSTELDESLDKRGLGYPLHVKQGAPKPVTMDTTDLEGEELKLRPDLKTLGDTSDSDSVASYGSSRSHKCKNHRTAAEEHRRQLQALLMEKTSSQDYPPGPALNGLKDDNDDAGTVVLENYSDLESEGVENIPKSGVKLAKGSNKLIPNQEDVKVSICARCARVITGLPTDRSSDGDSIFSSNTLVDDDFESVSQVGSTNGAPPRVSWPAGFDTESEASPRRGVFGSQSPKQDRGMLGRSSSKPDKGRHMYRGNSSKSWSSPRPPSSASERSDDGLFGKPGSGRKWKYGDMSSDNEGDTYRLAASKLGSSSKPWSRPPADSESESGSVTWEQGRKKIEAKPKSYRRYLGNLSDSDS
ncbi:uncharacterized protein C8orf34 homolog [Nematostella vectensis]|uniref:uncharacterized protein C8orf34 homolog n=1 Tax=Nematostella vectensis TaxID=45351 RepID=UPI0020771447|nr:uncharacterized protein C8orf34 homolog [Nematostella vectensis]